MPNFKPDLSSPVNTDIRILRQDSVLWRIHLKKYRPTQFNHTNRPKGSGADGGRFDKNDDGSYGYFYAGSDTVAAVTETLLRDRKDSDVYRVPRSFLANRMLSKLRVVKKLEVVKLHGNGLAKIGQDSWLTACDPNEYDDTREWSSCIRNWAPTACGFRWRPRHDNDRFAFVFFDDRCTENAFEVLETYPIDQGGYGYSLVKRAAKSRNAIVSLT